jgi:glycosyltransferase involved in cell wall biosynthesis
MFVDPETVSVVRKVAYWLRRGTQSTIDGAICASDPLTTLLKTENTVVFRGFPSIGMPDELPEPVDDSGSQTVMFSGRFDDVRGINTFLDIVPAVAEQVDDARFWIAGYGDEKACARIQAEAETLSCNATYFGTLPWEEYRARIVSANVLVNFQDPTLPISQYTFPSKLLDYMSAGATVVTTNVGDIKETFRNELYITAFDDEKLANAVAICLTEEEMNSYNDRAQAWIKKECDEEVVGKRISRVLETAI